MVMMITFDFHFDSVNFVAILTSLYHHFHHMLRTFNWNNDHIILFMYELHMYDSFDVMMSCTFSLWDSACIYMYFTLFFFFFFFFVSLFVCVYAIPWFFLFFCY